MRPLVRLCRAVLRDESGAVLTYFVILLPLMLLMGGFATDVSMINAQKRYTQSQADLAAQSAARHLPDPIAVRAAARRVVAANPKFGDLTLADSDILLGHFTYETGFTPLSNQVSGAGATAVRVAVSSPFRPILLAPVMTDDDITIRRSAVGNRQGSGSAVFVLRNRLLGVNTKNSMVLDSILGPLGLGLTTNLLSYEGLANLRLKGDDILGLLSLGVAAEAVDFNDVLSVPVAIPKVLQGLKSKGFLPAAAGPWGPAIPGTVTFAEILGMDPGLMVHAGDILPDIDVSALEILTTMAALAAREDERIGLNVGLNLAPLANVDLDLGLIRPPVRVYAETDDDPAKIAAVEQLDLSVGAEVMPILGMAPLLKLEAALEVGGAEAQVTSIDCSQADPQVTFRVTTYPAAIDIKLGLLDILEQNTPRALDPIRLAGTVQTITIAASSLPKAVPVNNELKLSGITGGLSSVLQRLKSDAEAARTAKENEKRQRELERQQREQERQDRIAEACRSNPFSCLGHALGGVVGGLVDGLSATIDGLTSVIGALGEAILEITSVIDGLTQVLSNLLLQNNLVDTIVDKVLALLGIEEAQAEIVLEQVTCGAAGGVALVQ